MQVSDPTRRTAKQSPGIMTKTYLIWCHCQQAGWGQSFNSVADALGYPTQTVVSIARGKGWLGRFRSETPNNFDVPSHGVSAAADIEQLNAIYRA